MGTTADKLQAIIDSKAAIKDAIEAKGVAVGDAPLTQYASKIGDISGGQEEAPENDVNFYDYTGFRVASYSIEEAKALTQEQYDAILPPTHEGLTFQEWNWTLEDIQGYNRRYIDIGANYITTDGKTHIKVDATVSKKITFRVYVNNGTAIINYGDNTTNDTITKTNGAVTTLTHEYEDSGIYDIQISFLDNGNSGFYGISNVTLPLLYFLTGSNYSYSANSLFANIRYLDGMVISLSKQGVVNPSSQSAFFKNFIVPKSQGITISKASAFYQTICKPIFPKQIDGISTSTNVFGSNMSYKIVVPEVTSFIAINNTVFSGSYSILSIPSTLSFNTSTVSKSYFNSPVLEHIDIVNGWIPNDNIYFSGSTQWTAENIVDFFTKLGTTTNAITLTFGATNLAKLTEEEKAIATNKGYTLA